MPRQFVIAANNVIVCSCDYEREFHKNIYAWKLLGLARVGRVALQSIAGCDPLNRKRVLYWVVMLIPLNFKIIQSHPGLQIFE